MTTAVRKESLLSDRRNCDPRSLEGNSVPLFSFLSLLSLGSQGKGNHRMCKAEQRNSSLSFLASEARRRILWNWKVWVNNRKKRELNDAVCELQESPPGCTWKYLTLNNTLKILKSYEVHHCPSQRLATGWYVHGTDTNNTANSTLKTKLILNSSPKKADRYLQPKPN